MNKRMTVAAVCMSLSVALAGCSAQGTGSHKTSVSGTVTEREIEGSKYELDIVDRKGNEYEINVTLSVYNKCKLFKQYPSCASGLNNSGKVKEKKSDKKEKKKTSKKKPSKRSKK